MRVERVLYKDLKEGDEEFRSKCFEGKKKNLNTKRE